MLEPKSVQEARSMKSPLHGCDAWPCAKATYSFCIFLHLQSADKAKEAVHPTVACYNALISACARPCRQPSLSEGFVCVGPTGRGTYNVRSAALTSVLEAFVTLSWVVPD